MMFIGTETIVTQLVYESSGMQADQTTRELRMRPQEEVTLICGGTGSFGRSDAQCAPLAGRNTA